MNRRQSLDKVLNQVTRTGLTKVEIRQKSFSDLARKKQSSRPKLNPVIKVAATEGDTKISAVPGKAGPGKRDSWYAKF